MDGKRVLKFLILLNVLLLAALLLSILTEPPPATAQLADAATPAYAMVAGEAGRISRRGSRDSVIYIADLRRNLVLAVAYELDNRSLTPIAIRSIARDIEQWVPPTGGAQ